MSITDDDLSWLFNFYSTFKWGDSKRNSDQVRLIQDKVASLISRDYKVGFIENTFCATYPLDIILMGNPHNADDTTQSKEDMLDAINKHEAEAKTLEKIMEQSKTIARSAALSDAIEMAYQTFSLSPLSDEGRKSMKAENSRLDVAWLQKLRIKHICDFMLEDSRKVLALHLFSSENASQEYRTAGFRVNKMPFPGVDAFYRLAELADPSKKSLPKPDWNKKTSHLQLYSAYELPDPYNWAEYMTWDINELTQNYVRYILNIIRDGDPDGGILLHCISGWDRTPLMTSIIRILAWAEGEAHSSLNASQMLYLSLAYDWLLFGHQIVKRMSKLYEILWYSYYVLQHLLADEFSIGLAPPIKPHDNGSDARDSISRDSTPRDSTELREGAIDVLHRPGEQPIVKKRKQRKAKAAAATSTENGKSEQKDEKSATKLEEKEAEDEKPAVADPPPRIGDAETERQPEANIELEEKPAAAAAAQIREADPISDDLRQRRQQRKLRLFEFIDKFMKLYASEIEPKYRKRKTTQ